MERETLFAWLAQLGLQHVLNRAKSVAGLSTVLCLHRVSDDPDSAWPPLKPAVFEQFARYLAEQFHVISLAQLREGARRHGKPSLVLTFDDGYSDFIDHALPVLRKYGLPSVHNVVVECVETGAPIWTQRLNHLCTEICRRSGSSTFQVRDTSFRAGSHVTNLARFSTDVFLAFLPLPHPERLALIAEMEVRFQISPVHVRMMNWDDLRSCQKYDVEIGSHSMTHSILTGLPPDALRFETRTSRDRLSEQLNVAAETIAFPNGAFDDTVIRESQAAGYRNLLTVDQRSMRRSERQDALIPRILVAHHGCAENIFNTEGLHGLLRRARRVLRH